MAHNLTPCPVPSLPTRRSFGRRPWPNAPGLPDLPAAPDVRVSKPGQIPGPVEVKKTGVSLDKVLTSGQNVKDRKLSGKRTVVIAPWTQGQSVPLQPQAQGSWRTSVPGSSPIYVEPDRQLEEAFAGTGISPRRGPCAAVTVAAACGSCSGLRHLPAQHRATGYGAAIGHSCECSSGPPPWDCYVATTDSSLRSLLQRMPNRSYSQSGADNTTKYRMRSLSATCEGAIYKNEI